MGLFFCRALIFFTQLSMAFTLLLSTDFTDFKNKRVCFCFKVFIFKACLIRCYSYTVGWATSTFCLDRVRK